MLYEQKKFLFNKKWITFERVKVHRNLNVSLARKNSEHKTDNRVGHSPL